MASHHECSFLSNNFLFLQHTTIFSHILSQCIIYCCCPIQSPFFISSLYLPHFKGWSTLYKPVCHYPTLPCTLHSPHLNGFVELFSSTDGKEKILLWRDLNCGPPEWQAMMVTVRPNHPPHVVKLFYLSGFVQNYFLFPYLHKVNAQYLGHIPFQNNAEQKKNGQWNFAPIINLL